MRNNKCNMLCYNYCNHEQGIEIYKRGLLNLSHRSWWPSSWQVWHLITGSHVCAGLTHTSGNAEDLPQYDSCLLIVFIITRFMIMFYFTSSLLLNLRTLVMILTHTPMRTRLHKSIQQKHLFKRQCSLVPAPLFYTRKCLVMAIILDH